MAMFLEQNCSMGRKVLEWSCEEIFIFQAKSVLEGLKYQCGILDRKRLARAVIILARFAELVGILVSVNYLEEVESLRLLW